MITNLREDALQEIIGVEAEVKEKPVYFKSRKAVVLAVGGLANNPEMLLKFGGRNYDKLIVYTAPGNVGDGFVMGHASRGRSMEYGCGNHSGGARDPIANRVQTAIWAVGR